MSSTLIVMIASAVLVILFAVGYSYAQRVKKRIEESPPHRVGPPLQLTVSPQSAERLSRLSGEPIFVKESESGTRVQIDNRPLVPLAMLTDQAAILGLREVIVAATARFGRTWTGLVSIADEGTVSVQRLS